MTRQEFYEKYGDVKVKFNSYYRYIFTYSATLPDGSELMCEVGGNSAEICDIAVDANEEVPVISLEPYEGHVYKNGAEVEGFYDY